MILLLLIGVGFTIGGFRFNEGGYFINGIECLVVDVVLMGFFYIVEAAYRYIEKCNNEEYESTNTEE